jgi:hypothetical protein
VKGVVARQVTSNIVCLKSFQAHGALDGLRTADALKWIGRQLGHDFGRRFAQWWRRKRIKKDALQPPQFLPFLVQSPPPLFLLRLPPLSNHEVVAACLAGKDLDRSDSSSPARASCTRDNHVDRVIAADQLLQLLLLMLLLLLLLLLMLLLLLLLLMPLYHVRNERQSPKLLAGLMMITGMNSNLCACHLHRLLEHDNLPDVALPALGILFPSVSKLHFLRKER